jgi:asparagine synthase (glutamine-hydrolysing)
LVLPDRIYPYPAGDRSYLDLACQFEQSVGPGRYRAILSGIGGDELLGGVPTPLPELADYIRRVQPRRLLTAATEWCIETRTPLVHMIATAFQFTRDIYRPRRFDPKEAPPWLSSEARQICLRPHRCFQKRLEFVSAYPSELSNGKTWWAILETLPSRHPHFLSAYEYRYPYLDRDLVDFLHGIPREVLIRPGRRRLLMRRALKEIVPNEIIERKRKAFISRTPVAELRAAQERIEQLFFSSELAKHGLIDRDRFIEAFRAELGGNLRWLGHLKKAIEIELWLQSLLVHSVMLQISA